MIGKIKGVLSELEGNRGLVETASGLFYHVYLTPDILTTSSVGSKLEIYTFLNVKEDSLTLFGFTDKKRHDVFLLLLAVDGVGPKLAFSVISYASPEDIIGAVTASNHAFFNTIPGIGKKTAHKILLELSTKLNTEFSPQSYALSRDEVTILDALSALGFERKIATNHLAELDKDISIEEKIKQAIRIMTKK